MRLRMVALAAGALAGLVGQSASGKNLLVAYRALILDGHQLKWGAPQRGTPADVTYALVGGERHFAGARNCSRIQPMDALLAANSVALPTFRSELRQAFRAWESVAAINFTPGDPQSADILIGAQIRPRGRAFTNVSYDKAGTKPGTRSITQALICLNPAERWKVGFDGNLDVYDLRYTLMHEIGHAIGLNHPAISSVLMHFAYREDFRVPQAGDVDGAVALYGAAPAPSDVASAPKATRAADSRRTWGEAALHRALTVAHHADSK